MVKCGKDYKSISQWWCARRSQGMREGDGAMQRQS